MTAVVGLEGHMEKIWMRELNKKVQKKALGSEKKCYTHGNAEQVCRYVTLWFLQKTCVNFVWSTSVFCPQSRV